MEDIQMKNGVIREIMKDTYMLDNGFVRGFLLVGEKKALVVDTGASMPDAKEMAEKVTDKELILFNTHMDGDHTSGNSAFSTLYINPAELISDKEKRMPANIVPVWDGDTLDLGGRVLTFYHTPGHTPGSTVVIDKENRFMISGDSINKGGRVFMFGMTRNVAAYYYSMKKMLSLRDQYEAIFPSHDAFPLTAEDLEKQVEGLEKVLSGEVQGTVEEMRGNKIKVYDLGICGMMTDPDSHFEK